MDDSPAGAPARSGAPAPHRATDMPTTRFLAIAICAALLAGTAAATERPPAQRPTNAAWQTECGACHTAFPPSLLDAATWRRVMDGLEPHFGSDASLAAEA